MPPFTANPRGDVTGGPRANRGQPGASLGRHRYRDGERYKKTAPLSRFCQQFKWPCTCLRIKPSGRYRSSWLGSGTPAAPGKHHLPLLPPGPDGVHGFPLRGTRTSTPLTPGVPTRLTLGQEFDPALADCGYRAPLPPRLARPNIYPVMARPEGIEPPTYRSEVCRSIQLSYGR